MARRIFIMPVMRKKITLGGDFDGLGTPAVALETIMARQPRAQKRKWHYAFGSEVEPQFRAVLKANHEIGTLYDDASIEKRSPESVPRCDIYVAGAPCQPFCHGGKHEGEGAAEGMLIWASVAHIVAKKPNCFVLEESDTFGIGKFKPLLDEILANIGLVKDKNGEPLYVVKYKVLNNIENGLPSVRKRTYIVGMKKYMMGKGREFTWPTPLPMPHLSSILDATLPERIPTTRTVLRNLLAIMTECFERGFVPNNELIMMDVWNSAKFGTHWLKDIIPTLTKTRAATGGFYISKYKRMMTTAEMLRSQGFDPARFTWEGLVTDLEGGRSRGVTERQFRMMVGNSMALPVVGRVMLRALIATGQMSPHAVDPWRASNPN